MAVVFLDSILWTTLEGLNRDAMQKRWQCVGSLPNRINHGQFRKSSDIINLLDMIVRFTMAGFIAAYSIIFQKNKKEIFLYPCATKC